MLPAPPGLVLPRDEELLLERAAMAGSAGIAGSDRPQEWSERADIDDATARLYCCAARRAERLISLLHAHAGSAPTGSDAAIVIVPGAFRREHPWTGADGARIVELARDLGTAAEVIALPSLARACDNAQAIAAHLRSRHRPTILVSLSKGGADIKVALSGDDTAGAFESVTHWLDLSGMTDGTPLVAWLRRHRLRCLGVRALLAWRRLPFAAIDELTDRDGSALAAPPRTIPWLRHIRVLGFPLRRHLSNPWARRGHSRLAALGPNDGGGVMLARAIAGMDDVLPIWGADHYLQPAWDVRRVLLALLRLAMAEGVTAARRQGPA